ncbi:rhodanese-related sulfurtransferase [Lutibacter sp. Hel_I_33_5]|uniref:rhodanese-like domain-containing protein n=1 Tax=Lutibacter sp. Hel_I_33_5 TaxID=1566289 RepID=UPI0011A6E7C3|nr:rhodanese-like domain-containing protein [Lutibacter sp. Hel_I_33_5]TVZ56101.1 rhodanese-related sulfurtransferase [Lutibacter sp. Hel_I_33_5]
MRSLLSVLIINLFFSCTNAQEDKSISTIALKKIVSKNNIQLLDVRTPKEIDEGYIIGARFANFYDKDFYKNASSQLDKSKPVYLYCRSGKRSEKSAKILQENGFVTFNVIGGYNQWKKENN